MLELWVGDYLRFDISPQVVWTVESVKVDRVKPEESEVRLKSGEDVILRRWWWVQLHGMKK